MHALADNDAPEQGSTGPGPQYPADVAAILRMTGDPSSQPGAGDMAGGGQARPAQAAEPRPEPRTRPDGAPQYQVRVHTLQPTLFWTTGLAFASWQKAHRGQYGHLPDDTQFGVFLSQAVWRDFMDSLRRGDAEQYDPLGMSFEGVSEAMAQADQEAGEGEDDGPEALDAYRDSILQSGRDLARQGVTLDQFLDVLQSGRGDAR